MKKSLIIIAVSIITLMLLTLAGCGGNSNDSSDETNGEEITALVSSNDEAQADGPGDSESQNEETQVVEQALTEQISIEVDANSSADMILGNWSDINDKSRFAKIHKDGDTYQFEDNEGKYPAEFVDGILKVKLADNDTADVYIDTGSGNLKLVYLDSISEFQR